MLCVVVEVAGLQCHYCSLVKDNGDCNNRVEECGEGYDACYTELQRLESVAKVYTKVSQCVVKGGKLCGSNLHYGESLCG